MILKDQQFYDCARVLKIPDLIPSDPDKKQIERAFRKLALKTHPDKGGDAKDFRRVHEAYHRLIAHITKVEAIEADTDLATSSVIIEISTQAIPTWIERFNLTYGRPRTDNVKNTYFEGPVKQWKGHGHSTGSLIICLYEDPPDKIPKIHCRCGKFMIWLQELNLPLHMHVQKDKKIRFDQWRIMSMAEFGFCKLAQGSSARHDWKDRNASQNQERKEKEEFERRHRDEEERKRREEQEEQERLEKERLEEEEKRRKEKEDEQRNRPWWHKHVGDNCDYSQIHMGETTPPPEDLFPDIFDPSSPYFSSVCDSSPSTTRKHYGGYSYQSDDFFAYKPKASEEKVPEERDEIPTPMRSVTPEVELPEEPDNAQVLQDILNEKRSRFETNCPTKKPRPKKPTVIEESDCEYRENIRGVMKGLKSNKAKSKAGARKKSLSEDSGRRKSVKDDLKDRVRVDELKQSEDEPPLACPNPNL